ncbi:Extracellular membrane protein, CFEM domain protein [Pseudohyphozyma bogoriensis]|nr:Extracellular membrane protein, CFEM domain protein [Pseudohyphozyma bogoriensis]
MLRALTFLTLLAVPSTILAATTAATSSSSAVPTCVLACIASSTQGTSCATTDAQCLCTSSIFIDQVAQCFGASCSAADQAYGDQYGAEYCATVGVTISIPEEIASSISLVDSAGASTASACSRLDQQCRF